MTDLMMDTVGIVRYLEDDLPASAAVAVDRAERGQGSILIPQIAMGEFIYIALKGRLRLSNPISVINQVLDQVKGSSFLTLPPFPEDSWEIFVQLNVPELHDRMIAAEALYRNLPLISNDPSFRSVKGLRTVWK